MNIFAHFAAAVRARRTARILRGLSDRELKDIGLSRSEIERTVRSIPRISLNG